MILPFYPSGQRGCPVKALRRCFACTLCRSGSICLMLLLKMLCIFEFSVHDILNEAANYLAEELLVVEGLSFFLVTLNHIVNDGLHLGWDRWSCFTFRHFENLLLPAFLHYTKQNAIGQSQESKCKAGASLADRLALCHSPSYSGIRSSFAESAAVINQSRLWFVFRP